MRAGERLLRIKQVIHPIVACSFASGSVTGRAWRWLAALLIWLVLPMRLAAYSLLTHEQVVDIAWKDHIVPILLARYPGCTAEELRQAHAHAYGGCLVQDLGYYPFGSRLLSELTHYVRSGDFVANLVHESTNQNELAFALGALAHYSGDSAGHPIINHAVALSFATLRARYGEFVTYEEDPKAHIRTEFGFDLEQVARNRYTADRYRDFIGFEVSKPLLERAFFKTYGLHLEDVLGHVDLAIGTFRYAVSQILPEMTRVALLTLQPEIVKETPNFSERQFLYHLSRADYEKEWGTAYRRPGILARLVAFFWRLVPKVGPLKALDFKVPTHETEDLYIQSVDETVNEYRTLLRDVAHDRLHLPNVDLDTGKRSQAGEYALSDEAYAQLLNALTKRGLDRVNPELRENILAYYATPGVLMQTRKQRKAWCQTLEQLHELRTSAR